MAKHRYRIAALLLALTGLLGGCALQPLQPGAGEADSVLWKQHQTQLSHIAGFTLQGRITNALLGPTVDWYWRQTGPDQYTMQLRGPFGAGAVRLDGNGNQVTVRSKDGETRISDVEAWMRLNLGWSVPVDSLRAWAVGLPASAPIDALQFGDGGLATQIQQQGWTIEYQNYADTHFNNAPELALPQRMSAQNADTHLRIIVDRWVAIDYHPST